MVMVDNGKATYSKTPFKEGKHQRASGGTFSKKSETEEDDVSYHHKFSKGSHPRKADGSFGNSGYPSDGVIQGMLRYGKG